MPKDIFKKSGRAIKASKRKTKLIERLIKEGRTPEAAKREAEEIMRDNPRADWRNG